MGAPRVAGGEGSGGGCPGVRGGGGVGWGGGGGVEGVRARGCVPGVGGGCVCVWVGGGMSRGSGLALGGFGTVWSGVGTVPQGRTLGSPRPALGPGRPGPWPPRLPGSRASPSAPVQGHSCPGGTATTGCPACPVLGRTQPTAGSWRALGRAPLGSAREENGGWSAGALARGWRPQPRGWGVGGAARGGVGWGGVEWGGNLPAWGVGGGPGGCLGRESRGPEHSKEPHRQPNGPGPLPPTRGLEGGSGRARSLLDAALSAAGRPGRSPSRAMPSQQPPAEERPRLARRSAPGEAEALQAG